VKRFSLGTLFRRVGGVALVSSALLAAGLSVPADSAPAPGPAAAPCLDRGDAALPAARRDADTTPVTPAMVKRVRREVAAAKERDRDTSDGTVGSRSALALPTIHVKVQIHLIHGSHKRERAIGRKAARRKVFAILQNAYNGGESASSEPMGVVFRLKRITISKNDRWYHARPMSSADVQMKNRLHRGGATTLNIYVNKPKGSGAGLLLGYSRFPWQYRHHKKLDGVTINVRSLPGGTAWGYNLGDSVVHETGHWLGLWHTFQGGCDGPNDGVADTPAEKNPYGNFDCVNQANLCNPDDVLVNGYFDPAYNFMEYTKDACMQMFTAGQHERVSRMFATFRAGR
jgi:hypothetical protein